MGRTGGAPQDGVIDTRGHSISIPLTIGNAPLYLVGKTMRAWLCRLLVVPALLLGTVPLEAAEEQVGEAILIKTSVTGNGRSLATKSPVHRDERIRTSSTGLGEFVFRDGTKFAVGWNSSVVIDKFVFSGNRSVKDLTIKAAAGSFRWISGGSRSSAYKIQTPSGTIGIRGTAFDVYVGSGGTTAVVLLSGTVRFCGANGCRELRRRCDYIVATPGGGVSLPARVSSAAIKQLRNGRAMPFVTGQQRLSGRFQVGNDCLTTGSLDTNKATKTRATNAPETSPGPDNPPDPDPSPDPDNPPDPSPSTGKGNNGRGNGGGDGSPNGRGDTGR